MALVKVSMKKLNRTSLYNNVHFLAFGIILFIFSLKYWWIWFLLIPYLIFLYYKTEFFKLLLCLLALVMLSYLQYYPKTLNYQFNGLVLAINDYSVEVLTTKGKAEVFGYHELSLGDYAIFETTNYHFSNSGFDYQTYLENKGVLYFRQLVNVEVKNNYFVMGKIQAFLSRVIIKNHPQTGSFLTTLLLGDNLLSNQFNNQLKQIGIAHLLAISGLHITILIKLLIKFLDKFFYFEKPKEIIITCFLISYIFITNFSLSVIRAALMVVLKYHFKAKKDLFTTLDNLSFITIGILLVKPKTLFLIGFQLSYLISFIMITFVPTLKKGNLIVNGFKVGLFAYLSSLPIVINLNYEINLIALITSPIYSLYFELLLLPCSILTLFIPTLEKFLAIFINLFMNNVSILERIKIFSFITGNLDSGEIIIYYCIFFILLAVFHIPRKRKILTLILSLYLALIYLQPYFNPKGIVTVYDVGQGDSILISLPYHQANFLVDCYGDIASLLKKDGIRKINYLIITHGHNDHLGAIDEILDNYQVKTLYTSKYDTTNNLPTDKQFIYLEGGDEIIYQTFQIQVLGPLMKYSTDNNNSLVLWFELEGVTYLLTGDVEGLAEKALVERYRLSLASDVLKVAHHGSNTSSTDLFLQYVNPTYYAISVGYQNRYQLPNHKGLLKMDNLYRTDYDGSIYFEQKNGKLLIKKSTKKRKI